MYFLNLFMNLSKFIFCYSIINYFLKYMHYGGKNNSKYFNQPTFFIFAVYIINVIFDFLAITSLIIFNINGYPKHCDSRWPKCCWTNISIIKAELQKGRYKISCKQEASTQEVNLRIYCNERGVFLISCQRSWN